jgi:hypothetical protein
MIQIQTNNDAMRRAANRAKAKRPTVKVLAFRLYQVINREGRAYNVAFYVERGRKLAQCTCAAGESGQLCYHVASALPIHCHIAKTRQ